MTTTTPLKGEEHPDSTEEQKRKKNYTALRLFVGQIPFSCTKEDLERHFADHGAGKVVVRLLTEKGTGKSRGMAFVECASDQQLVRALRLHHTRLQGRAINVERTVGGGGNNPARKEKLKKLKEFQGSKVRSEVEDLVQSTLAKSNGLLKREHFSAVVVEALAQLPRNAAKLVLEEILTSDLEHARDKIAWMLGCIGRYVRKMKSGENFLTLEEEKAGVVENKRRANEVNARRKDRRETSSSGVDRKRGKRRNEEEGQGEEEHDAKKRRTEHHPSRLNKYARGNIGKRASDDDKNDNDDDV